MNDDEHFSRREQLIRTYHKVMDVTRGWRGNQLVGGN